MRNYRLQTPAHLSYSRGFFPKKEIKFLFLMIILEELRSWALRWVCLSFFESGWRSIIDECIICRFRGWRFWIFRRQSLGFENPLIYQRHSFFICFGCLFMLAAFLMTLQSYDSHILNRNWAVIAPVASCSEFIQEMGFNPQKLDLPFPFVFNFSMHCTLTHLG